MQQFDVLIIGSGMGGLVCGDILSREGYRVCIVEKNKQIGGCLQIFVRKKVIFDSGVHYLGGLDKGQTLYQIFKYLGLMDQLKLEKMDEGFDRILIGSDKKEYIQAQGYPQFIKTLVRDFPEEETGIRAYCDKITETCNRFPLYHLQTGDAGTEKLDAMQIPARAFIESIIRNPTLQAVLAGNNMLYAGVGENTAFYVHALIVNSYIESAWRCVDGGGQIASLMASNIRSRKGVIIKNALVKKIAVKGERVSHVEMQDGSRISASHFISNIPPVQTYRMTETNIIRKATRQRLEEGKTTVSSFIINIVLKKESFPYLKYNYYYHRTGTVWTMENYTEENWPLGYAIYMAPSSRSKEFADGLTIFAYMRYEEVSKWADTFNTVSIKDDRGPSYAAFKKQKAEKLLDAVEERFPGLRDCIDSYYTSTPLSYRDYIGNDDGALYGYAKNFRDPYGTLVSAKTKLPNLFFTGQHLNLHGILGSAISGLITCSNVLGNDAFIEKIKNA